MKIQSTLAGVKVGDSHPPRLMGVINVSPESFFKGSVPKNGQRLAKQVRQMTTEGADFIDVGAMSTAPYLKTKISPQKETSRLSWAIKIIKRNTKVPISADTSRPGPALAALKAGAAIINDVHGLLADPEMPPIAKKAKGVILMAHPRGEKRYNNPIRDTVNLIQTSIKKATSAGISPSRIVIDPGIGFFRNASMPWWKWDIKVIQELEKLRRLKQPILLGVSRKSFIGKICNQPDPKNRLMGSLGATAVGIIYGAHIIRTHDVKETKEMLAGLVALL